MALAPASRHASWIHLEKFQREYQRLQPELDRIEREHGSSRRCAVPTGAVRASFCTLDLTESSQNQLAVSARCMRRIAGSITCRGKSAVTSIRHVVSDSTAAATAGPNSGISETLRAANPKA